MQKEMSKTRRTGDTYWGGPISRPQNL